MDRQTQRKDGCEGEKEEKMRGLRIYIQKQNSTEEKGFSAEETVSVVKD